VPYIQTADRTGLFYTAVGDGPPVLLVHAWSLSSAMWEYQVRALVEAGFRCVAMDRRGHGRSDVPGSGYDLDTLADDLARLIELLDLKNLTVVAHSMGTCETTRYLTRHGTDRVRRVALLGAMTPHLSGAVGSAFVEAMVDALVADRPRWFQESAPAYFATGGTGSWVSPALVDDGIRQILATPLEVQIACLRAFTGTDLTADLQAMDIPALVLHGDADASAPIDLTGRPTAKLLPRARFRMLDGAPHGLYVTARREVNDELVALARGEVDT
jgi:non-heme chloroperoxidase